MKRKLLFIVIAIIAVSAVVIALVANQELISRHMYPQDSLHEASNLALKGTVTSIERNHKTQGMIISSYHIFRMFIQLNITEVVWGDDYLNSSVGEDTLFGSSTIGVGYDFLEDPLLSVGQEVDCKGFYFGATDSPYSFILTVSPSVSDSYLSGKVGAG